MKNGADCDEPICVKTDPLGSYKRYMNKGSRISFDDIADDEPSQKKTEKVNNTPDEYRACPNTRESLGFFTWNFLHTMSVYYPENPTEEQKTKMRQFVAGLAEFYPCKMCAAHLKKDIEKSNLLI
jgi:Mitochondrial sulfhydryl oxidase involved in the biogenesis of cytosolic Fe/S proteins